MGINISVRFGGAGIGSLHWGRMAGRFQRMTTGKTNRISVMEVRFVLNKFK